MALSMKREKVRQYAELVNDVGVDCAAEQLGIKRETLRRIVRQDKAYNGTSKQPFSTNLLQQLQNRFSESELQRLLSSSHFKNKGTTARHEFGGGLLRIGVISDTHLGSIYTDPQMLYQAFDEFHNVGVDFIVHTGDVFEGLSHRAGHCYECSHLGYSAQLQHGREVFMQWTDTPIYIIDGNHDRWYIKSNGAVICEELARSLDNVVFLGHDEGDIEVDGISIKLWHGEDGASYALSYRVQKIVESFSGGEKPQILLTGHDHKAMYVILRNIHCLEGGAIQKQSKWMRSKRQASITGFWIAEIVIADGEVKRFKPEFFPYYR